MSDETQRIVRAVHTAVRIPGAAEPYDTAHLKVSYPGRLTGSERERNFGVVEPDREQAPPWPVVLFLGGIDIPSATYQWLGRALVERGVVFATYDWVASPMPGHVALTPGLDLDAVRPETYGTTPTSPALRPVLDALAMLGATGHLEGMLDLDRVVLGGHSAGGAVALHNARRAFFPEVRAAFSYAAHAAASTMLGYEPASFLPLGDQVPLLLMTGSADGVIASSAGRYGLDRWPADPVETTFERAASDRAPRYFARLQGAGHFLIAHPHDAATGRAFLEPPAASGATLRAELVTLIADLVAAHTRGDEVAHDRLVRRLEARDHKNVSGRVRVPVGHLQRGEG